MDEAEALELIDAHLDHQPIADDQAHALAEWLREHPEHAEQAFHRIFLHSFLRQRLQHDLPLAPAALAQSELITLSEPTLPALHFPQLRRPRRWRLALVLLLLTATLGGLAFAWLRSNSHVSNPAVYEGFDYPPTVLDAPLKVGNPWPTEGGLSGLDGGRGWAGPWHENGSKVSVLIGDVAATPWRAGDMRQFGPLAYIDFDGHGLETSGIQMRSPAGPSCITTRAIAPTAFPESFADEKGIGRDGAVVWVSFLAQSFDGQGQGTFAYLQVGTETTGLRVGKLTSIRSGEWSTAAVSVSTERNARSSTISSGQAVFIVIRITFRSGAEQADIWIDPQLDREPAASTAKLKIPLPDFRLQQLSIQGRYSTDFDELRIGKTFSDVAPMK